jgi:hypothetical protein
MVLFKPSFFITFVVLLAIALPAEARPFRVNDIPNGSKYTCLNCHGDMKASYNTDFGSDARFYLIPVGAVSTQHVDWTPLCPLDSDRDGWTNGHELGDPDCVWKMGDPNPQSVLFNPGVFESAPPPVCGSGKLEANEDCDGDLFVETDCALLGAGEGALACTADCEFDYSQCSAPPGTTPVPNQTGNSDDTGCSIAIIGSTDTRGWLTLGAMALGLMHARRRSRRCA